MARRDLTVLNRDNGLVSTLPNCLVLPPSDVTCLPRSTRPERPFWTRT